MRVRVVATAASVAVLLAACTPVAAPLARDFAEPVAVPQDLTWQYVTDCMLDMTSGATVVGLAYDEHGVEVTFDDDTAASILDQQRVQNCFAQYRIEDRATSYQYVGPFERAELWDYYNAVTVPCLAERGVTLPDLTRAQFFLPDQRPWNPYTAMDDLPFDQLLALYHACPPMPDYLLDRHEP